jgi:hypothetical protein
MGVLAGAGLLLGLLWTLIALPALLALRKS